jgi:hypothetical protein
MKKVLRDAVVSFSVNHLRRILNTAPKAAEVFFRFGLGNVFRVGIVIDVKNFERTGRTWFLLNVCGLSWQSKTSNASKTVDIKKWEVI